MDTHTIPHLQRTGESLQLIVNGEPFLILGGQVQNSSMSSAEHMRTVWLKMKESCVNTVLGAVTWEQIEPFEDHFDFKELDQIILDARRHGLHLVLLWFGAFKKAMSTYAPRWVKHNNTRFPRALIRKEDSSLVLTDAFSIFDQQVRLADAKAFTRFMEHLRKIDLAYSTVIMVQVENEVGILGDSRDRSHLANAAFEENAPDDLLSSRDLQWDVISGNINNANDVVMHLQDTHLGESWLEVFSEDPGTDELFMAYHFAKYVEYVACAGKEVYALPLYTNVWLNYENKDQDSSFPITAGGGSTPGVYPSGGAVPGVLDTWKLCAPSLDFIAPDIYLNDYESTCEIYSRGQPLFVPEQRRDKIGARCIWHAIGSHKALGTSPFGIDTVEAEHGWNPFKRHYGLLSKVSRHILEARSKPGSMIGFFFDELPTDDIHLRPHNELISDEKVVAQMGSWELSITRSFVYGTPWSGCGMVIMLSSDDLKARFLLIGWGFQVSFRHLGPYTIFTGISSFKEKDVMNKQSQELRTLRWLNGDETRSGSAAVMPTDKPDYGVFPISTTIPAKTGLAEVEVYALQDRNN